jgi:hypothetical protein
MKSDDNENPCDHGWCLEDKRCSYQMRGRMRQWSVGSSQENVILPSLLRPFPCTSRCDKGLCSILGGGKHRLSEVETLFSKRASGSPVFTAGGVFLVPKKSGVWWMIVDLRRLNRFIYILKPRCHRPESGTWRNRYKDRDVLRSFEQSSTSCKIWIRCHVLFWWHCSRVRCPEVVVKWPVFTRSSLAPIAFSLGPLLLVRSRLVGL